MSETTQLGELAQELLEAERSAIAVEPLSERAAGLGIDHAYGIQRRGRELRVAAGAKLVGHKIGLTSEAMRQQLGVDQPDFGYLAESMRVPAQGRLEIGRLIAPRIEAEIAFLLSRPLGGAGLSREDVLGATESVAPALEVIDSRIADWRITIVDTIADNASCGRFVVGEMTPLADLDLAALEVEMTVAGAAGEERVQGNGAAVLGHPAEAIAWLAAALAPYGEALEAGEIVLPGAMAKALPVAAGDTIAARFAELGEIELQVTEEES